jgi:hypothetical protein
VSTQNRITDQHIPCYVTVGLGSLSNPAAGTDACRSCILRGHKSCDGPIRYARQ